MATNAAAVSRKLRTLGYDLRRTAGIRVKDCYSPLHEGDVFIRLSSNSLNKLPRGLDGLIADLDTAGLAVIKTHQPIETLWYGPTLYIEKKEAS